MRLDSLHGVVMGARAGDARILALHLPCQGNTRAGGSQVDIVRDSGVYLSIRSIFANQEEFCSK